MYHFFVRRTFHNMFQQLSAGNWQYAVTRMAPVFEHTFAGEHCLGGTRHTIESFRRWFERLYRLFPNLQFEIHHVAVSGWPWDTTAVAEWTDRATPKDGQPYVNRGVHVVRLRWGRVVSLHAYLDTRLVTETCRRLAEQGIEEAAAAPIVD